MSCGIQKNEWLVDLSDEQQEVIAGGESNSEVNFGDVGSITDPESAKIFVDKLGLSTTDFIEDDSDRKLLSNSQPKGSLSILTES